MHQSPYRFPRTSRLTTAAAYRGVFAAAIRSSDGSLIVLAKGNGLKSARLGLAIAKRHVRRASDRNRIKRVARETFRLNQHKLAGIDFVVMARTAAIQADNESLSRSLLRHWAYLVKQCKLSCSRSSDSTAM